MKPNKKGVQEIVSYVIILAIVISFSTVVYIVSKDHINNQITIREEKYAELKLNEIYDKINQLKVFDGDRDNIAISTNQGIFELSSSIIQYRSSKLKNIRTSDSICINNICEKVQEYQLIKFINLTSMSTSLNISDTVRLDGSFILNIQNTGNSINIRVK